MKLNIGQLILILSAFPPKTKVVLVDQKYGCTHDEIEVKEREWEGEVVIGIGEV